MQKDKKAVLVTGGGVRLGRSISLHLAKSGWDIGLHYCSSYAESCQTQKEIQALGSRCELFPFDFTEKKNFDGFIEHVFQTFPHLSTLVNNASVYQAASLRETPLELWDNHFKVNVRAPFFLIQAFAKHLKIQKSQKHKTNAAIVISILDNKIDFAQYQYAAYVLSKKTLAELSLLAAMEFSPDIRVNAVAPGVILPKASRSQKKGYLSWRAKGIPLQKQGSVQNILLAVDYLLENDFVTGQILNVDGGESMSFVGRNYSSFLQRPEISGEE